MKRIISLLFFVGCAALMMTGCASGPQYSTLHGTEPALASGNARVYVYRAGHFVGSAVQPDVKLNDQVVGSATPGGYFFFDRPAGNYEISATTEVRRSLSLTLEPAQERYVRLNIGMGFFVGHVWPELIDNQVAGKEIQKCHYTGK